jgi:hypothetical protein
MSNALVPRFLTTPSEIQSKIIRYLTIQDLLHLYQTSQYWRRKIGDDKVLWREMYERMFGCNFAKDRWILWAIRRLWSQESSGKEHSAAQRVNLTTLERLDASTWRRLVRGRILTMRNWRDNIPQRSIVFPKGVSNTWISSLYRWSNSTYGLAFATEKYNGLGFAIVDDTLSNEQLLPVPDMQVNDEPRSCSESGDKNDAHNSVILGQVVPSDQRTHKIQFDFNVSSEEFIVVSKSIRQYNRHQVISTKLVLAWDIGQLKRCRSSSRSYCIPSLCMTELLPDEDCVLLEQQSGWLLVQGPDFHGEDDTQEWHQQYMIYDLRHARLAASFIVEGNLRPIIGRATPEKVQIYYGYATRIPNISVSARTAGASETELYQYHWYTIEISTQSIMPVPTMDPAWCSQMPSLDAIE